MSERLTDDIVVPLPVPYTVAGAPHAPTFVPLFTAGQMHAFADAAIAADRAKAAKGEAVGTAEPMPGSAGGFTTCVFTSEAVPVGAKLYTHPAASTPKGEADASKDTKRLNAIERELWFVEPDYAAMPATWRAGKVAGDDKLTGAGKTLRQAIDAALAATSKGGGKR